MYVLKRLSGYNKMTESQLVIKAREFATEVHKNRFRKDGKTPAITHPKRVAESYTLYTDTEKAVGWLHDVIEDSDFNIHHTDITNLFFDVIGTTVRKLTHYTTDTYPEYIVRIGEDPLARKVKLVDITDNLNDNPSKRAKAKYALALSYLLEKKNSVIFKGEKR